MNRPTALRGIPAVDALLARAAAEPLLRDAPHALLAAAVRAVVERFRGLVRSTAGADAPAPDPTAFFGGHAFLAAVEEEVSRRTRRRHVPVLNATGILLHTGLGRAPLAEAAADAVRDAARHVVVEVDRDTGERDHREARVAELACALTGAAAATVVNNNAAGVLLVLAALAAGREVIVSRGELVEIGGGFRLPDVMAASGVALREVGTTNRTYAADVAAAVGERTALLLKVHTSNFRVVGFTAAPSATELAALARDSGVPFVHDVGSGLLRSVPLEPLAGEPTVAGALADGADLVTFSGDKLLGACQAGFVVGRRDLVERVRAHPLFRAVRPGKLELAALEATLLLHQAQEGAVPPLPLFEQLALSPRELRARGERVLAGFEGVPGLEARLLETRGYLGSGSAPVRSFDGLAVALAHDRIGAGEFAARLRRDEPAVFARVEDDRVLLELRSLFADQIDTLIACVRAAAGAGRSER